MKDKRRPNFFIVGAPKCGTSSLINTLRWHPNVYVPLSYEPQFFSTDFKDVIDYTTDSYLELFSGVSEKQHAVGEKSVIYLYSNVATKNILEFDADARLIVMLRNPVDLLHSWHAQLYYSFLEDIEDFTAAWEAQEKRARGELIPPRCAIPFALQYREIGMLGKYVKKLLTDAPREQIKIIFMEDFHKDSDAVYRESLEFLQVPYEPRRDPRKLNSNKRHRYRWLGETLAHDTHTRGSRLINGFCRLPVLRNYPVKYWLHEFNKIEYKRPPLSQEMRAMLIDEFREDVAELADLTGRDLSHWSK
jgi:hypothetical protein